MKNKFKDFLHKIHFKLAMWHFAKYWNITSVQVSKQFENALTDLVNSVSPYNLKKYSAQEFVDMINKARDKTFDMDWNKYRTYKTWNIPCCDGIVKLATEEDNE